MPNVQLHLGDALQILPTLAENSIDALVLDPPYMIDFMGKAFDTSKNNIAGRVEVWAEMLRVAKPGAHLLAFGGDRTHHRMMCAIEDAGWELRTCLYWCFSQGFPKSHDVSKALDRMAGAEREVVGERKQTQGPESVTRRAKQVEQGYRPNGKEYGQLANDYFSITAPATDAAKQWLGWGSALKPSVEIIVMARKPLSEKTIAANVLRWGTGALAIDKCRIDGGSRPLREVHPLRPEVEYNGNSLAGRVDGTLASSKAIGETTQGRWPANLCLSDDAAALLDEMSGTLTSGKPNGAKRNVSGPFLAHANGVELTGYGDSGGASRFFARFAPDADDEPLRMMYCPKASKRDRDSGLEGMPERECGMMEDDNYPMKTGSGNLRQTARANHHPCVKPLPLMRWLTRLVCRPGGTVLDPFCGSGSTGKACMLEGFNFVGVELDPEYLSIAEKRIEHARQSIVQPMLELS